MKAFTALDDLELEALLRQTSRERGKIVSALVEAKMNGDMEKAEEDERRLRAIDRKHKALHDEVYRRFREWCRKREAGEPVASPHRRNINFADDSAADWGCDMTGHMVYSPRSSWDTDYNY